MPLTLTNLTEGDHDQVLRIVKQFWGDHTVVRQGEIFNPTQLEGIKAVDQDRIVGILHYQIQDKQCEILTLASLTEGRGVGSALLNAVEILARNHHCHKLTLITTNDNLHALGFYQRRGFCLAALYPEQVALSRKIKPAIPETGQNGIPIHDEIRLEKDLSAPVQETT